MRKLYLLRGAPASGKSTFIEKHGLQPYTLSPDVIRLMFKSPVLKLDGEFGIAQEVNAPTWKLMFEILEKRMVSGETTFIDATHTKMSDISQYKKLAENHRYSLIVIDFSDVPEEELILRNSKREHYKVVPENVIERMCGNLKNPLSNWVRVLKPEDYFGGDNILDFSSYKKIHHFGDLHGCWSVVEKYFEKYPIQSDELYIFTGDYVDRGIENHLTMKNIMSLAERKNFIFIEGNHEIHLWNWANDFEIRSPEFKENTLPQLEENGVDKKDVRVFCRKLKEFVLYSFHSKQILVNHAGISNGSTKFPYSLMSSRAFIYGIGGYGEEIDALFSKNTKTECYQVHGHRNKEYPILASEKSFNLEGKVEFGGNLRVLTLDSVTGFEGIEIENDVYSKAQRNRNTSLKLEAATLLEQLQNNPMVQEKAQGHGISSFNFRREVFFDKLWNTQTVKARGLFIDTETNSIVARSYDKFFNYKEMLETSPPVLKENLKFPVNAFVKENGFLGIVGYSKRHEELLTASKSTLKGIFAQYFSKILADRYNTAFLEKYSKENDVSLIFEVIDVINDPHIIEYPESKVVLLDIVENKIDFKSVIQPGVADKIGCEDKRLYRQFFNWQELQDFLEKEATEFLEEGFVFEDAAKFKFKFKCPFYAYWKKVRNIRDRLRTDINTPCVDEFYLDIHNKLKENPELLKLSIPELRNAVGPIIIDLGRIVL